MRKSRDMVKTIYYGAVSTASILRIPPLEWGWWVCQLYIYSADYSSIHFFYLCIHKYVSHYFGLELDNSFIFFIVCVNILCYNFLIKMYELKLPINYLIFFNHLLYFSVNRSTFIKYSVATFFLMHKPLKKSSNFAEFLI